MQSIKEAQVLCTELTALREDCRVEVGRLNMVLKGIAESPEAPTQVEQMMTRIFTKVQDEFAKEVAATKQTFTQESTWLAGTVGDILRLNTEVIVLKRKLADEESTRKASNELLAKTFNEERVKR